MIYSIIVARSSQDRHDVSCKSQIHEIREAAVNQREHIVKVLEYPGTPHSEYINDPSFQDLLAEVKSKTRKWSKVWFYDTSRVSRSRFKAQALKTFFKNHGVTVEFLKVPKTGIEALDNVIEGMLESFDQMHSDFSRAGAKRGQKQNIRAGYRAGGRAPYGYRLKKHVVGVNRNKEEITKSTLEPHPDTFQFAKEYLERRAAGESRRSVMQDFMKRGIPSPSGKKTWYSSAGKSIEENVMTYQGHLVYNRHNERINKRSYKGGTKWRDRSDWVVQENAHEGCISDDMAKRISMQIDKNRTKRTNPGPKRYLLTDLLVCGDCGGKMTGNSGFYACLNQIRDTSSCANNQIKADFLDTEILKYLKTRLITKDFYETFIQNIQDQYEQYKKESFSEQERHLARIAELDTQIDNLLGLLARGKIKPEHVERSIEPLQAEKEELEIKSKDINQMNEILDIKVEEYSSDAIRNQLDRFEEIMSERNIIELRSFVRDFIHEIKLFPKEDPRSKKWKRPVHIQGYIRALTMKLVASPRGTELHNTNSPSPLRRKLFSPSVQTPSSLPLPPS